MDFLALAAAGFRGIDAPAALKDQALKYLQAWLQAAEFAAWVDQKKKEAGLEPDAGTNVAANR